MTAVATRTKGHLLSAGSRGTLGFSQAAVDPELLKPVEMSLVSGLGTQDFYNLGKSNPHRHFGWGKGHLSMCKLWQAMSPQGSTLQFLNGPNS